MFVSRVRNLAIWNQFGKRHYKPSDLKNQNLKHYTLGSCIWDSDMKIHDMYLYLRYKNFYVLFSDWRTVVRLHLANPIFPREKVLENRNSQKAPRK